MNYLLVSKEIFLKFLNISKSFVFFVQTRKINAFLLNSFEKAITRGRVIAFKWPGRSLPRKNPGDASEWCFLSTRARFMLIQLLDWKFINAYAKFETFHRYLGFGMAIIRMCWWMKYTKKMTAEMWSSSRFPFSSQIHCLRRKQRLAPNNSWRSLGLKKSIWAL